MTGDVSPRRIFLRQMAERYCWDAAVPDALGDEPRILLRVMDLGVIEDLLRLERVIGHDELVIALERAPPGSLRPRSWDFWHYRLRLTAPDERPPPMPKRLFA